MMQNKQEAAVRILKSPWGWTVAALVALAYFGLQYAPYSEHSAAKTSAAKAKRHWNPEIYKSITALEIMPITAAEDEARAADYRLIEPETKPEN